jgi:hypothetical protein
VEEYLSPTDCQEEKIITGIGPKSLELNAVKGGAQKSVKQLSLKRITSIGTGISPPGNPERYTFIY